MKKTPTEICAKVQAERNILDVKFSSILSTLRKKSPSMTPLERITYLNKKFMKYALLIIYRCVAYQTNLSIHNDIYDRNEEFLRKFIPKKSQLQKEITTFKLQDFSHEKFKKQFQMLMHKCDCGNYIIRKYLNKKYGIILLKTNRDIYREILSYL